MPFDSDTNPLQLQNQLEQWVSSRPISHWGATELKTPLSIEFYRQWLELGYHASMSYLKDHLPQKSDPQLLGAKLKSSLIFAFPYAPHPEGQNFPIQQLRTALYARGEDYHFWIKRHLQELVVELKKLYPEEEFLVLTDSGPVLERDLAYRAGLGWIGKNTMLIHPQKGSLFLLGEVLTSLPLHTQVQAQAGLQNDFCGKCRACIDVCPTQAIKAPRLLEASRCISFLTIESREIPPEPLRNAIGDWFFGCDLCQTVCPWNQKPFKGVIQSETATPLKIESQDQRRELVQELQMILRSSGKHLERTFKGTPLLRAGPFGLKRNALLVAANKNLTELVDDIKTFLNHPKLGELATWALEQMQAC
jgi:epoxyqueuosine reductase